MKKRHEMDEFTFRETVRSAHHMIGGLNQAGEIGFGPSNIHLSANHQSHIIVRRNGLIKLSENAVRTRGL